MSDRNITFLLEDIIECIDNIFTYTTAMTYDEYLNNNMVQDAVERNYEIIGEAASKFDQLFREKYPNVDWRLLKDFRNVIIHRYFDIYQEVLWNAKEFELAALKEKIAEVLKIEKSIQVP
jgi:uncharacterized protein with HEPN domain